MDMKDLLMFGFIGLLYVLSFFLGKLFLPSVFPKFPPPILQMNPQICVPLNGGDTNIVAWRRGSRHSFYRKPL